MRSGNASERPMRVLMVTAGWPSRQAQTTHFIKRQAEFLRAAGVDVEVFHFRGGQKFRTYVTAWARVRSRLMAGRYDLVHAQFGQSGLLALPKRVPLIVTLRGDDLQGIIDDRNAQITIKGRILQRLSRWVASRADAVIVVSDHMRAFLDPGVHAHVIPSGLDLSVFRLIPRAEARRHLGLPEDKRLVLFGGNPACLRKRFALARDAVEILKQNGGPATELIIAWGVPHSDMPYYMSACDALVFTSMQEGSPNVVKEALASNLPVVSVRVGDVPTRLQGVTASELCADERPETIAAALARVLQVPQRSNGRETVMQLDEHVITAKVIGVYRSVLKPPPQVPLPIAYPSSDRPIAL
jgi:teichuronic acid biosynthesis glycosyltransferase TuaC